MTGRVVEGLVALGVLASAGILGWMLVAPFLPEPTGTAPTSTPTPSPVVSAPADTEAGTPPLGTFKLRGRLGVQGRCLGLELGPQAYPVAAEVEGTATVLAWSSPVADSANPQACDGRAGDLHALEAAVTAVADEDDRSGPLVGYSLSFRLPSQGGFGPSDQEIVILLAQSSAEIIQALDMTTSGGGLVFERVEEIDPPLVAVPSAAPAAALPSALFLLRGPLDGDGPCLVLDTGPQTDLGAERTGSVRWWQPGNPDLTDAAACLTRIGEVQTGVAEIVLVTVEVGPASAATSYAIRFSLPGADGQEQEVVLDAPSDLITADSLTAFDVEADDRRALTFDRVDAIDPPLASPES